MFARVRDLRHHAAPDPEYVQAADLLTDLARNAMCENSIVFERRRTRNSDPNHYTNRPGAFLQERCTPAQRELLTKLISDPHAKLPSWFMYLEPEKYRDFGPYGQAKSPPTWWKMGIDTK